MDNLFVLDLQKNFDKVVNDLGGRDNDNRKSDVDNCTGSTKEAC